MKRDFFIGITAVAVIVVTYVGLVWKFCWNMELRGQFGDLFGGLNAIFSGLAFMVIFISLKYQRIDLKLSIKEMKRSSDANERNVKLQNEMITLQASSMLIEHKMKTLSFMQERIEKLNDLRNVAPPLERNKLTAEIVEGQSIISQLIR